MEDKKNNQKIKNFFKFIQYGDVTSNLLNFELTHEYKVISLFDNKNHINIIFKTAKFLKPETLINLYDYCFNFSSRVKKLASTGISSKEVVNDISKITFTIKYDKSVSLMSYHAFLCRYFIALVKSLLQINLSTKDVVLRLHDDIKKITVVHEDEEIIAKIKINQTLLADYLNSFGYHNLKFSFSIVNKNHYHNQGFFKKTATAVTHGNYFKKPTGFETTSLREIVLHPGDYCINAQIFNITRRLSQKNTYYYEIHVTDWDTSVRFLTYPKDKCDYSKFKINDWVQIKCQVKPKSSRYKYAPEKILTRYSDDNFMYSALEVTPWTALLDRNISIVDKKRVELSVHSKMTAQNSVCSATSYLDFAVKMKMPAIAITDFNSVQAFPEIANHPAVLSQKIKPIYGFQADLINDAEICSVLQAISDDQLLMRQKYCVFDLETTGLFANFNSVIEFGCCSFETDDQGVINLSLKRDSFFVKCDQPLPQHIINHTGIKDEMLANQGILPSEAAKKIHAIIQDKILIAHNAKFDLSFLNAFFSSFDLPIVTNTVIDTVWLSRFLFPEYKSHALGFLSKKLSVDYFKDKAHRAVYDANVLQQIFSYHILPAVKLLFSKNSAITLDIKYLKSLVRDEMHARNFGHRVTVLAKNKNGLKNLYKLISLLHTKTIYPFTSSSSFGIPKLHIIDWDAHKNDLLLASHCSKGEIFNAVLTLTEGQIITSLKKYDYIEIPPPNLLNYVLYKNQFNSEEQLHEIILKLIAICKSNKKLYPAVSDAYFLHPWHKKFRLPFIFTKGLRGRFHEYFDFSLKSKLDLLGSGVSRDDIVDPVINAFPNAALLTVSDLKKDFKFITDEKILNNLLFDHSFIINHAIEHFDPLPRGLHTPVFDNAYKVINRKIKQNFAEIYHNAKNLEFHDRLKLELDTIKKYHYEVIYYLSYMLTSDSQKSNYLVGSRGSVGSSFAAFLLNITEVNPLSPHYFCDSCDYCVFSDDPKYKSGFDLPLKKCPNCQRKLLTNGHNIPFATFLGIAGEKVPDIDLNFSGEYQKKAHNYIKNLVGESNVFRAGTITTYADRMSENVVNEYFDLIKPTEIRTKVDLVLYKTFITNCKRSSGQHPGGLVVVPNQQSIFDFTPFNFPADDLSSKWKTTHFAFESLHNSLLKLDLLGHDDPTILKQLYDATKVNPLTISFQDKNIMAMFNSTDSINYQHKIPLESEVASIGVPEFGTVLARRMLKETCPTTFADLIKISGLSHGRNVWKFNLRDIVFKRKEHSLQDVMGCRDDIMVDLINYGLKPPTAFKVMESVRRGHGVPMGCETEIKKHNIPQWYVDACHKISYLFPKAHATAYVIMAWRIAYYKLYYPLEFYSTHLSIRFDSFDYELLTSNDINSLFDKFNEYNKKAAKNYKNRELALLSEILIEMQARDIKVQPISLTKSLGYKFIVDHTTNSIIPPFRAISSLGATTAQSIINARKEKPFTSLQDFLERSKVNIKQKSKLINNHIIDFK